jgi:hypothetical protein
MGLQGWNIIYSISRLFLLLSLTNFLPLADISDMICLFVLFALLICTFGYLFADKEKTRGTLDWKTRLQIALDAARGGTLDILLL